MGITRTLCQAGTRVLTIVIGFYFILFFGFVLRGSCFVAQAGLTFTTMICLPLPELAVPGSLFLFLSLSLPPSSYLLSGL